MSEFEKWFADQDFYTNMRFIHGDAIFTKDGDVYRVLPVQMTYQAQTARQSEIDQLKAEKAGLEKRIKEILLNAKESMVGYVEADLYDKGYRVCAEYLIDDLDKALRGEHE